MPIQESFGPLNDLQRALADLKPFDQATVLHGRIAKLALRHAGSRTVLMNAVEKESADVHEAHYSGCFPTMQGETSRAAFGSGLRDNSRMNQTPLVRILNAEMKRAGFSEHSLAYAANLRKDAVRDILRGKSASPRSDTMNALAKALGRTVGQLLGSEPMTDTPQPPLARLPPEVVKDQETLMLVRYWGELGDRDRRVILNVIHALAADEDTVNPG